MALTSADRDSQQPGGDTLHSQMWTIQHSFQLGEPQSVAALLSADTHMKVLICLPRGSRYGRIKERNHWTLKHVAGERILRADPQPVTAQRRGQGWDIVSPTLSFSFYTQSLNFPTFSVKCLLASAA